MFVAQCLLTYLASTEYIFDENGGRGTPASTFFKRFAHKDTSAHNSNTNEGESETDPKVVGAAYNYADLLSDKL